MDSSSSQHNAVCLHISPAFSGFGVHLPGKFFPEFVQLFDEAGVPSLPAGTYRILLREDDKARMVMPMVVLN
ncbi:MAG: hypothetical protein KAT09_03250 [Candidatus Aegiribacteria sp.]|nr:hypothetical protein [Candidatus Aegiribacteria sp.]